MLNLVEGIHHFRQNVFESQRKLFEELAQGQHPSTLFITCSDSRVVPNLITQTGPGEMFVLQNAGNIIPAYGASNGGEGSTVEYALTLLNVEHVIVCGHSHCGAIQGLLNIESLNSTPLVKNWLGYAESTRRIVMENYPNVGEAEQMNIGVQENVLVQLENLQTYPAVAAKLQRGKLSLHGWVYKFETGEVFSYSNEERRFVSLPEVGLFRSQTVDLSVRQTAHAEPMTSGS